MIFLSHILDNNTPTYGNRNKFDVHKKSDISRGDVANDSHISTTAHIGTHIDMPYHFYENGKTIEDYADDFWIFRKPLFVSINPTQLLIKSDLLNKLNTIKDENYDILIVKTQSDDFRSEERFWKENYGYHPDVYDYLAKKFPKLRVFGFDSISVSSFQNRAMGREAHLRFLNSTKEILLLEDMKLDLINEKTSLNKIIIAPLRIRQCDGLPCTVLGFTDD